MQSSNFNKIKKVLIIIMIMNYIVAFTKIALGYFTNSNTIVADGIHSLSDGLNNIIGIVALGFAYKPADKEHPYGHKKIESILSLFIGFILLLICFNIAKDNILNFNKTETIHLSLLSIAIMVLTLIVNIFVTTYERNQGNELNSSFLLSDAAHTMSDVYVSLSVIISLIGIKYFNLPLYFDSIMSLVVAIFILKAAVEIIVEATKVLTDHTVIDPKDIRVVVGAFPEVLDVHYIKSRGFEDDAFVDLHILVNPQMSVKTAHRLSHDIEAAIQKIINPNTNVVIHIEPVDEPDYKPKI